MKKLILFLAICCSCAAAQTPILSYEWPALDSNFVAPGPLGSPIDFTYLGSKQIGSFTLSWTVSGAAPGACAVQFEGSFEQTNWSNMDYAGRGKHALPTEDCAKSGQLIVKRRPWRFLRIKVVQWTAAAGTTVTFSYKGVAVQP